jgi:hypothetical protein
MKNIRRRLKMKGRREKLNNLVVVRTTNVY